MNLLKLGVAAFLAGAAAQAQQIAPHVGYVYPAGGRQGTTFEVTVGGQFLDGVKDAFVSGAGVEAKVVELVKPMQPGQLNRLRDQMKELMDRKTAAAKQRWARGRQGASQGSAEVTWSTEDDKKLAEIWKQMAAFVRPASPALAEMVKVQVTVAADAEPGERELRLGAGLGLTNPLVFCVDQLPEVSKEPSEVLGQRLAANAARYFNQQPKSSAPAGPTNITLPLIVNGQIIPGGVDRYRFPARKGQHLVVAASARKLIPYLSDAVPGWFQATLALYDAKGKEVDYADRFRFHPDPVLYYEIPSDGDYVLEIKDSVYRGREDFVYRVALGELPFVTSVFPLGGKAGVETTVEMKGWNLPVAKVTQDAKATGIYPISAREGEWTSNRVPFAVDTLPESLEKEPNDLDKKAQRVKLPLIVNGRINKPGDWDVFRLEGRAGEEIVAEVFARRLDSPLDSILKLTDAKGRQLAVNDDYEDKGAGLLAHQADSRIMAKLPANGTYYIHLGDTQGKGGAEYGYRLRISRPQPDFELRVVPSSVNVRAGTTVPITVYALRRDGFAGDIALKLKDAPPGFALSGGWVPGNQDKVRLTLTVPQARMDKPLKLHLDGRATVQGKEVSRPGVPAEDMMQAFAYRHLVPAKEWMVRVTGSGRTSRKASRGSSSPWKLVTDKPVQLPTGGTAPVRVLLPKVAYADQAELTLNEPPEGIAIQNVSYSQNGVAILLRADAGKVKPGLKGNLIVDAFIERTATATTPKKKGDKRRTALGTLPAIPFEVVGRAQAQ